MHLLPTTIFAALEGGAADPGVYGTLIPLIIALPLVREGKLNLQAFT